MGGPVKNYMVSEDVNYGSEVIEKPTGLVIESFADRQKAKEMASFLNGGNAFNGKTPPFFLNKWQLTPLQG